MNSQNIISFSASKEDSHMIKLARELGWADISSFCRECLRVAGPRLLMDRVTDLESELAASQTRQLSEPASSPAPEPEPDPSSTDEKGSPSATA